MSYIDQLLLCAYTTFISTPIGKAEKMSSQRIWESVWCGFLNCTTYYLVLLPLCFGIKIPMIPWMMDYALGLSNITTKRTMAYWTGLYSIMLIELGTSHRLSRCTSIPSSLHDTTSWDAHIFGSGAPEEWLILLADIFMALCLGMPPASLNPSVLAVRLVQQVGLPHEKGEPS